MTRSELLQARYTRWRTIGGDPATAVDWADHETARADVAEAEVARLRALIETAVRDLRRPSLYGSGFADIVDELESGALR